MGLFWHVPGYSRYSYDERHGSAEFFLDERPDGKLHFFVIDGGEGILTDKLIADLNLFGAKREGSEIWTLITHGHYDHYYGIRKMINHKTKGKYTYNITRLYMYDPASLEKGLRDNKGSGYVRAAISTLYTIKKEAEARGIKVIYVKNKQAVTWGDLKWQFFREQPARVADSDKYGDSYLNDGSIATWFPQQKYLTSGDGPDRMDKLCEKYGLDPVMVKGPHHGNCFIRDCAVWMKAHGTWLYWDDDMTNGLSDFLQTGREDAKAVGMTMMQNVGDINGMFYQGKAVIYKDGHYYRYECGYAGKAGYKTESAAVIRGVLRGNYGAGDTRVTRLIAYRYNPGTVQKKTNKVVEIANGIKSGKLDYGKDKARIAAIDDELGKGYGQLVQDYINVLAGVREAV
jgi:hypothetical protein